MKNKYRLWDIEHKHWETAYGIMMSQSGELYHGSLNVTDKYNFSWSTKLHDKNGKEIWEGDILRDQDDECHGVVKWRDITARFIVETETGWFPIDKFCKVLGNIYENPELLK